MLAAVQLSSCSGIVAMHAKGWQISTLTVWALKPPIQVELLHSFRVAPQTQTGLLRYMLCGTQYLADLPL